MPAGYGRTSAPSQPDPGETTQPPAWEVGLGGRPWQLRVTGSRSWVCSCEAPPRDVWLNDKKHAPYASRAGHVHGLGQALRIALDALRVLHKLPGLAGGGERKVVSVTRGPCFRMVAGCTV